MALFPVLTPSFVSDLLYLTVACLLSKEDFDEFALVFDETRPSKVISDIKSLLSKCQNEVIPESTKVILKAIQILTDEYESEAVLINECCDTIQVSCSYDISNIISQVRKDFLEDTLKGKITNIYERLQQRLQYLDLVPQLEELQKLVNGEKVITLDDFMKELKQTIKSIDNSQHDDTAVETFDSLRGGSKIFIQEYKKILDPSQYIKSGYPDLDKRLYGGFAKTRIYVIAGPSGHGKSTYLLNWLCNAVRIYDNSMFMYITLENIVPETMLRIASILNRTNVLEEAISNTDQLDKYLEQAEIFLQRAGNRTIIKYFSPTTPIDYIVDEIKIYSKESPPLKAIFYDYLNVMGLFSEDMRRQLGQVTRKLKDLAVELKVPVITAAQLNRDAYGKTNPDEVGLHNIAESMLIVENADVLLLTSADVKEGFAHLQIKKRRYAKEGSLYVKYNPNAYLIEWIKERNFTFDSSSLTNNSISRKPDFLT